MDLFITLQSAIARIKKLREVGRELRKLNAKARGKKKRKFRLSRSRWIEESQRQGVVVAADRAAARKAGTLRDHLVKFYPAHQHGHAKA